jgi:hypothetical protein
MIITEYMIEEAWEYIAEQPENLCGVSGCNNKVSKYVQRGVFSVPVCKEHINFV